MLLSIVFIRSGTTAMLMPSIGFASRPRCPCQILDRTRAAVAGLRLSYLKPTQGIAGLKLRGDQPKPAGRGLVS